MSTIRIIPNN
jgi:magnesium-transporting ATPase (P-type)